MSKDKVNLMKAPINKIIKFSNVDGPGNRFVIFVQSCPFNCLYCHNPETINMCNNCGKCIETCPVQALSMIDNQVIWDKDSCVQCDTCIKTCPYSSSPKITYMSVDDVVSQIKKQIDFIQGITVSGGECTLYPEFLEELFIECNKLGLSCLLDSNGFRPFKELVSLLDYSDGVMLDVKATNSAFHHSLVGVSNDIVLANLEYLLSINKLVEVRTVILPNNSHANETTISHVSSIIKDKTRYKLIKYRPFGVREKGISALGNNITSEDEINRMKEIAFNNGATNCISV